jgi:hypothetical protein
MKPIPLVFLIVLFLTASVRSQDEDAAVSGESTVAPVALPTVARILGNIPDGTPPPPQPPKPVFIVPAADILASTIQQQGGRTITIQKIKPIALPPPPEPAPPPDFDDAAFKQRPAELRANHPRTDTLVLSATVYRSQDVPPRTLVHYRPAGKGGQITFWSSADFALISGIHTFSDSAAKTHWLFMGWGDVDTTRTATLLASRGREYHAPAIPAFPAGPATFTIVGTPPADPTVLVPIQSLHDLYNSGYARLKTAWEGRERARIEREAYLKANPPQPKNVVLNYWRTEKPAPVQGGSK